MLAIRDPVQQILDAVHSCTEQRLKREEIEKIIDVAKKIGCPQKGGSFKIRKNRHSLSRSVFLSEDGRAHIAMTRHKRGKDHLIEQGTHKLIKKQVSFGLEHLDQIEVGVLAITKKKFIEAEMKKNGLPFSWKDFRNKAEREFFLLRKLQGNSSIIKIDLFYKSAKKRLYLGMELGKMDLNDLINTRKPSFKENLLLARDCAKAVQVLHDQRHPIIHRDIKPENFLVMPNDRIKMIDLGLACEDRDVLEKTVPLGTPGWLSPEVAKMSADEKEDPSLVTPASDLFPLGLIICAIFTSRMFSFQCLQRDSPSKGMRRLATLTNEKVQEEFPELKCPEVLKHLILSLLDVDPQKRMRAGQAVEALENLLKEEAKKSIPKSEEKKQY